MSTKQNPGQYDCYSKLFPDEPYFVLRAKDPDAPAVVERWANLRAVRDGLSNPKIEEARQTAESMRLWRHQRFGAPPDVANAYHEPEPRPHGMGAVERSPDDEAHERPTLKDA